MPEHKWPKVSNKQDNVQRIQFQSFALHAAQTKTCQIHLISHIQDHELAEILGNLGNSLFVIWTVLEGVRRLFKHKNAKKHVRGKQMNCASRIQ